MQKINNSAQMLRVCNPHCQKSKITENIQELSEQLYGGVMKGKKEPEQGPHNSSEHRDRATSGSSPSSEAADEEDNKAVPSQPPQIALGLWNLSPSFISG